MALVNKEKGLERKRKEALQKKFDEPPRAADHLNDMAATVATWTKSLQLVPNTFWQEAIAPMLYANFIRHVEQNVLVSRIRKPSQHRGQHKNRNSTMKKIHPALVIFVTSCGTAGERQNGQWNLATGSVSQGSRMIAATGT